MSLSSCFYDLYYFFAPPSSSSEPAPLFSMISLTRSENFLFRTRIIDPNIPISCRESDKYKDALNGDNYIQTEGKKYL